MNIQDPLGELADERRAQQPHVSGETDQIHLVTPQLRDYLAVVHLAVQPFRWQAHRIQRPLSRDLETSRFRAIRNHHRDRESARPRRRMAGG